jgi:hypothetical protein
LTGIATCDNTPDAYHFTWDYRAAFTSECTGLNQCSQGNTNTTHTCNDNNLTDTVVYGSGCDATCDENLDCSNQCSDKKWYSNYSCNNSCYCDVSNPICSVGHCNAECDGPEECGNKCVGNVSYYSGSCLSNCDCSWTTEDCDLQDGWYDTGNTRWVTDPSNECKEKEQKEQVYSDYYCSETPSVACYHTNTSTQWVDAENTRNKVPGTECGLARDCPDDVCVGFFAYFYPDDGHDTCDGSGSCLEYSCDSTNNYCTDDNPNDGINSLECGAQCDQNPDCLPTTCSITYDDYCTGKKLTEYDSDKILDSTTVTDSCDNACQNDCTCTDCSVDCSPPQTNNYCVKDVCTAECDSNDDCVSGTCNADCTCEIVTTTTTTSTTTTTTTSTTTTVPITTTTTTSTTTTSTTTTSTSTTTTTIPDLTPPNITIISPQNTTYTATSFYLKVSLNEATSWTGYSLDSKPNVTLWTNKPAGTYDTYVQAALGSHNVIVYANDTSGNMGNSSKVYFTLKSGGGGGSCLIRGICAIEY